jgi:hypothetical protein
VEVGFGWGQRKAQPKIEEARETRDKTARQIASRHPPPHLDGPHRPINQNQQQRVCFHHGRSFFWVGLATNNCFGLGLDGAELFYRE